MITIDNNLQSLTPPYLTKSDKDTLIKYFKNTWALYESLFSSIKSDQTFYITPDPLRNPLIFYFGHTAAFYINKFRLAGLIPKGIDDKYDHLFAIGVDPNLPENLEVSSHWPSVEFVRGYRQEAYEIIIDVLNNIDETQLPIRPDHPYWSIPMTIEHDRIHFETSSVLIRQLDAELVQCPDGWEIAPSFDQAIENEWITVAPGTIEIGKRADSYIFGWDNEYGQLKIDVAAFAATKNLITNAEYLDFVNSGAYNDEKYWTPEGWAWKLRTNTQYPKFWVCKKEGYQYRAMFEVIDLPIDWPVEVNAHEAQAYCNWKGAEIRLLSEAEFNLIARAGKNRFYDPVFTNDFNLNFQYASPSPVGMLSEGQTKDGFNDIYGNVWDWLNDDFYPLPDFEPHPYYEDFSAPYMDKEHGMMAGGAWITTGTGASRFYRLWFRRHFFQHAGFRLAKSLE